tara:strand:+ start:703 stop:858 length:156 start_codon:yes stop_codon:yes gene_type:complete
MRHETSRGGGGLRGRTILGFKQRYGASPLTQVPGRCTPDRTRSNYNNSFHL